MPRLLVVTAVAAEADAVLAAFEPTGGTVSGRPVRRALTPAGLVDVVAGGVGPVEAALCTAALLSAGDYELALSAGIGGGFGPFPLAVAAQVAFADLGAQLADGGFRSVAELGFGHDLIAADADLTSAVAGRTGATVGTVLTVATVTGTADRAGRLRTRFPDAVAEGMEGFGVAAAAGRAGVRFGELRAISNLVGPRDRDAWRIPQALAALTGAFDDLLTGGTL